MSDDDDDDSYTGGMDDGNNIGFDASNDFYLKMGESDSKFIFRNKSGLILEGNNTELKYHERIVPNPDSPSWIGSSDNHIPGMYLEILRLGEKTINSPQNGMMWLESGNVRVGTGNGVLNLSGLHAGFPENQLRVLNATLDINPTSLDKRFGSAHGSIGIVRHTFVRNTPTLGYIVFRGHLKWYYLANPTQIERDDKDIIFWPIQPKRIQHFFKDDIDDIILYDDIIARQGAGWVNGKFIMFGEIGASKAKLAVCRLLGTNSRSTTQDITVKTLTVSPNAEEVVGLGADEYTVLQLPVFNNSNNIARTLNSNVGDYAGAIAFNRSDNKIYYHDGFYWLSV